MDVVHPRGVGDRDDQGEAEQQPRRGERRDDLHSPLLPHSEIREIGDADSRLRRRQCLRHAARRALLRRGGRGPPLLLVILALLARDAVAASADDVLNMTNPVVNLVICGERREGERDEKERYRVRVARASDQISERTNGGAFFKQRSC